MKNIPASMPAWGAPKGGVLPRERVLELTVQLAVTNTTSIAAPGVSDSSLPYRQAVDKPCKPCGTWGQGMDGPWTNRQERPAYGRPRFDHRPPTP